jgi:hypothetical protein
VQVHGPRLRPLYPRSNWVLSPRTRVRGLHHETRADHEPASVSGFPPFAAAGALDTRCKHSLNIGSVSPRADSTRLQGYYYPCLGLSCRPRHRSPRWAIHHDNFLRTSKKLSVNSKARNQKCYLSVEAAVIATTSGPFHQICHLRIDVKRCVAASKSAAIMNVASSLRKSNLCSS